MKQKHTRIASAQPYVVFSVYSLEGSTIEEAVNFLQKNTDSTETCTIIWDWRDTLYCFFCDAGIEADLLASVAVLTKEGSAQGVAEQLLASVPIANMTRH